MSATAGSPITVQTAATTGAGTIVAPPVNFGKHTFLLVGSTGISAGKVKIETAHASDYAGTWALLGTEQTLVASTVLAVVLTGNYPFLRARVSTTVEGGTLTAYYHGGT